MNSLSPVSVAKAQRQLLTRINCAVHVCGRKMTDHTHAVRGKPRLLVRRELPGNREEKENPRLYYTAQEGGAVAVRELSGECCAVLVRGQSVVAAAEAGSAAVAGGEACARRCVSRGRSAAGPEGLSAPGWLRSGSPAALPLPACTDEHPPHGGLSPERSHC